MTYNVNPNYQQSELERLRLEVKRLKACNEALLYALSLVHKAVQSQSKPPEINLPNFN